MKHTYKPNKATTTTINVNKSYNGESIEQKIFRIINNKEPITDGAPIIFTDRKDGVMPEYNPRTDKWELGVEAADKATKIFLTKREEGIQRRTLGDEAFENMKKEQNDNSAKPKP